MTDEESLFAEALAKGSADERGAFLDAACADNPDVRARVEALLAAHAQARGILETPPPGLDQTTETIPPRGLIGSAIGPYKLLEQIGGGGMGAVYMAEQLRPVRRKVALKIIKPGMDSGQVIARFEAERQALTMMDHPNIARVLDAGTTDAGRPYFVMELVKGVPITDYCDQATLTMRQRLELFVPVCQAVQHAHQKGIIHRDLKPTNVLVTLHDDSPVPKVIDFGIAKAAGQVLTERTLFTNYAQMLGTPLYMSPEQAQISGLDVDTRSDVYSLGVLLYELLTGTTPFEKKRLAEAAYDEMRRIIREEEPPRPSTRISILGDKLATVSAHCRADPKQLGRLVRGELDWIVMRALEKDRTRRYETANGLARDVERYLHDEPVEACPPSATYRLRKLLRRYRAPLAVAAGFVLLLVAASVISTWLAVRATRAERQVARQRDEVQGALVQKQEALAQRTQSERTARERLATQLLAVGDAARASGRSPARDSYREAWEVARELGTSDLPATTGLLASYAEQPPPLMGSDGRYGGIGGFEGHSGAAAVVFSTDGRGAVSAALDGSIIVWDVARGTSVRRFPGGGHSTHDAALSPDGRWLLTGGEDKMLRLWDVATGEVLRTFTGHLDKVLAVDFSPDGRRAISGSVDGTVRMWDVDSGKELRRLDAPSHVHGVAFSPDGRRALSSGEPDAIVLWDLESGHAIRTITEGSGSAVTTVSFSPDGRTALTGGLAHGVILWDVTTGKPLRRFWGHTARVSAVQFSPDGRQALSGGYDRTLRLWDVASARSLGVWHGHVNAVRSVCFSPNGQLALSGDSRGAIKLWDLREQQETAHFRGHASRVMSLCAAADGRTVLSGSFDHTVRLWDVTTGLPILTLATGDSRVWGVALAPDGRSALTAQEDGEVAVWDLRTASRLRSLGKHDDVATAVAFSPDGRSALSSSSDQTLKLWNLEAGESVRTFTGHSGKVRAVAFSPDGRTALSASFDNTLKLWDLATGKVTRNFTGHANWVHGVAFSPDGRRAASGGWDYRWGLWDVEAGTNVYFKQSVPDIVAGVAFSPDGKLLVTGSWDGSVGLWDLAHNVHVRDLRRQQQHSDLIVSASPITAPVLPNLYGITSVAFCRDGVTVLAGSQDGHLRRWQLDRPARYDEFAKSLPRARDALAMDPADGKALAVFGRWYAFRGVYDWAAEFLEKARERGADVTSLDLARCYWQLGRRADAAREFGEAIRRNEAPREYLELCLNAVTEPPHGAASAKAGLSGDAGVHP